jgi:hypothetical protein
MFWVCLVTNSMLWRRIYIVSHGKFYFLFKVIDENNVQKTLFWGSGSAYDGSTSSATISKWEKRNSPTATSTTTSRLCPKCGLSRYQKACTWVCQPQGDDGKLLNILMYPVSNRDGKHFSGKGNKHLISFVAVLYLVVLRFQRLCSHKMTPLFTVFNLMHDFRVTLCLSGDELRKFTSCFRVNMECV